MCAPVPPPLTSTSLNTHTHMLQVLPGLLLCLSMRFDQLSISTTSLTSSTQQYHIFLHCGKWKYFSLSIIGYTIGGFGGLQIHVQLLFFSLRVISGRPNGRISQLPTTCAALFSSLCSNTNVNKSHHTGWSLVTTETCCHDYQLFRVILGYCGTALFQMLVTRVLLI